MAAVLALLSTLVAAKLQLIQQWWLPTFDILDGCTCNGNNPTVAVGGLLVQTVTSSKRPKFQHSWFSIFFFHWCGGSRCSSATSFLNCSGRSIRSLPFLPATASNVLYRENSEGFCFSIVAMAVHPSSSLSWACKKLKTMFGFTEICQRKKSI